MSITIKESKVVGGKIIYKYCGLSSDEKPTNAPNASSFYEMDTGNLYMISVPENDNPQWIKQPAGGGGGDSTDFLSDEDIENAWG